MELKNDSSIHHIPKIDTDADNLISYRDIDTGITKLTNLRGYLNDSVEKTHFERVYDDIKILKNNESKESLIKSLQLINFPSSSANSPPVQH